MPTLESPERLVRAQSPCEIAVVVAVATTAMDAEERRPRSGALQGHERSELLRSAVAHRCSNAGDRSARDEGRMGQAAADLVFDAGEHVNRLERVATQAEEIVVQADVHQTEHVFPDCCDP